MSVFFIKRGTPPTFGKHALDYTVGESVFLIENNSPVEYIVVHQGNPDVNIYDTSCDGTFVLRK